jgi:hypothetical protein
MSTDPRHLWISRKKGRRTRPGAHSLRDNQLCHSPLSAVIAAHGTPLAIFNNLARRTSHHSCRVALFAFHPIGVRVEAKPQRGTPTSVYLTAREKETFSPIISYSRPFAHEHSPMPTKTHGRQRILTKYCGLLTIRSQPHAMCKDREIRAISLPIRTNKTLASTALNLLNQVINNQT